MSGIFSGGGAGDARARNMTVICGKSNGDSAVTITWNENTLAAGESRTYKTYTACQQNYIKIHTLPPLFLKERFI